MSKQEDFADLQTPICFVTGIALLFGALAAYLKVINAANCIELLLIVSGYSAFLVGLESACRKKSATDCFTGTIATAAIWWAATPIYLAIRENNQRIWSRSILLVLMVAVGMLGCMELITNKFIPMAGAGLGDTLGEVFSRKNEMSAALASAYLPLLVAPTLTLFFVGKEINRNTLAVLIANAAAIWAPFACAAFNRSWAAVLISGGFYWWAYYSAFKETQSD